MKSCLLHLIPPFALLGDTHLAPRYLLAVYPLASGLPETVALSVKVLSGGRYPCISYGHGWNNWSPVTLSYISSEYIFLLTPLDVIRAGDMNFFAGIYRPNTLILVFKLS